MTIYLKTALLTGLTAVALLTLARFTPAQAVDIRELNHQVAHCRAHEWHGEAGGEPCHRVREYFEHVRNRCYHHEYSHDLTHRDCEGLI